MGFATFIGSTSGDVRASSATWTLTWSNTMLAGDLILIGGARDGNANGTLADAAATYSSFASQTNGNQMRAEVWHKVSTGGETGATLTWASGERGSWQMRQYRGQSTTPTATSTNGNSSSFDPPSHSGASAIDHTWVIFAGWDVSTASVTMPSGYGNQIGNPMSTTSGAGCDSADKQVAATQTEDPPAILHATAQPWGAFTIAIPGTEEGGAPAVGIVQPPFTMMGFGA